MTDEPKPEIPQDLPKKLPKPLYFPPHLKDHANFDKIQRALLETLASTHSHGDMIAWSACFDCQQKVKHHSTLMKTLGFETSAHYLTWKRIHTTIKERVPLAKYNSQ